MKKLALIALIAFAAAPALAQTAKTTPPKPVAEVKEPAAIEITDATPLDVIVQEAPDEDRAKMLRRCMGPPPKLAKEIAALKPASEPAVDPLSGGG
jgi:hypothetical protein